MSGGISLVTGTERSRNAGGTVTHAIATGIDDHLVVEETDVLGPRQADEHPEIVLVGEVEQPARRHGEAAQRVGAHLAHEGEVSADERLGRKLVAVLAGGERTIGDGAQVKS